MSHPSPGKSREVYDLARDPTKHFVRRNGWVPVARARLAKLRSINAQRPYGLRYFTLCGKDGIDIFLFKREGLITDDGRGFPSVLYCESDRANFAQVRPLLGRTKGERAQFEELIKHREFRHRIEGEPFDVINLDFSGSCFPRNDYPFSRTLRSVNNLIQLQQDHEFDLFVTFKALRSADNRTAINELTHNMKSNFENSRDIETRFKTRFAGLEPNQLLERNYGQFLLATFPKIVFGFGSASGFVVKCPNKFVYQRMRRFSGDPYQIVKFLFSFECLPPSQSFSETSRRPQILAERYKMSTLSDLGAIPVDVDNELRGHSELFDDLGNDCQSILESRKALGT